MASNRTFPLATILILCLSLLISCSTSFRGLDLSKHLIIKNNYELGPNGSQQAIKLVGNSSRGGSIKQEDKIYLHTAGYMSKTISWHGVRAMMNIWKIPDVQPLSSSGAYISAIRNYNEQEFIAAGVHVIPSQYKDNDVHFFTFWTSKSDYSTGCFNTDCPGFVIANGSNLLPGQSIAPPLSTYGGEQRGITIRIKKDENTGDWSLYREDLGGPIGGMTLLGWWPSSLFQDLSYSADAIQWAGFATHTGNETAPPMGSGHFASELEGKAASFNDCFGFDENGHEYNSRFYYAFSIGDKPDCYTVSPWYQTKHAAGRHFFYGGPSGCSE